MNTHTTPRNPTLEGSFQYLRFIALAMVMSLITPAAIGDSKSEKRNEGRTMTGKWFVTVMRPSLLPIRSWQTYSANGNVLEESNSVVPRSLAHGTWEKVGKQQFTRSGLSFNFDAL